MNELEKKFQDKIEQHYVSTSFDWRYERVSIREEIHSSIMQSWLILYVKNMYDQDPFIKLPDFKFNGWYYWINGNTVCFTDKEDFVKAALILG